MKSFIDAQKQEGEAWETLMQYQESKSLGEGDVRKIALAAGGLAAGSQNFPAWQTTMNRQARELGLTPDPTLLQTANPMIEKSRKAACEPYL